MTMVGIVAPSRRLYLPCALLILGYSFLRTILPPEQLNISGCALVALVTFGSAIFIAIATRHGENGKIADESAI